MQMAKKKTNPNHEVTFEPTFNGKPILTDKEKGYGCREDILQKIDMRMDHGIDSNRKTIVTRMDFTYPKGYDVPQGNKQMSSFLAKFKRNLNRDDNAAQYVCVREQSREKHQHYHLLLIMNQDNHQFPNKPIETAEKLWASTLGVESGKGLVDHCRKSRDGQRQTNFYRLNPKDDDFEQQKAKAFQRASYLAKTNTKGNQPKGSHDVLCSRIPKDKK
jgi:hypothetical protein